MPIIRVKRYKSPDMDQIPAELIKAGGRTLHSEYQKLIIYTWKKKELSEEWNESIIVPIYKNGYRNE
jgi:hypothetical protein